MAELVTQWIEDGTAGSIVKQRVQAARQRKLRAEKILGRAVWPSKIASFHLWLALSVPWRVTELIERAASEGILLASTDVFVPGRAAAPHAIRICTGTEADEGRVERALRKIAHILQTGPTGFSTGPL
jgi:DNA-binding transcriptional MocR family regulator